MKYVVRVGEVDVEVDLDGGIASVNGEVTNASASELPGTPVRMITIGDQVHRVIARRGTSRGRYTLWVDGFRYEVEALDERSRTIRELSAAAAGPTGPAPLVAPMPGMIVRVTAQVGDVVVAGQGLVVMEAMKMENELRAAAAGTVKAVLVQPGMAVEKGAILLEME